MSKIPEDNREHVRVLHLSEMAAWLHRRGKSMPVEDLTDDQKHDIRECFELFDADHSGALDVDEVLEACEVLGLDAGGTGGGGMITRLFDEMEQEGIDELDFEHFESVVCRTLGDIALERSRAQQVDNTAGSGDVLSGTRDRAMVFKRKQLLGSVLRGGKDLSDLVAAQDDLMAEINQRFARSVQVDGNTPKKQQLIELLNGLDPVASAVAPNLSDRFKFFEDMARSKESRENQNAGERQPWAESGASEAASGDTAHLSDLGHGKQLSLIRDQKEQEQPALRIRFGGDKITVKSPRTPVDLMPEKTVPGDEHESLSGGAEIISKDIAAMGGMHAQYSLMTSCVGRLMSWAYLNTKMWAIYAPPTGRTGTCTLRCVSISEFYEDSQSNVAYIKQAETPVHHSPVSLKDEFPRFLLPALNPSTAAPNRMLTKRLATVNSAVPICSLIDGKIVAGVDQARTSFRDSGSPPVPRLPLHKLQPMGFLRANPSPSGITDADMATGPGQESRLCSHRSLKFAGYGSQSGRCAPQTRPHGLAATYRDAMGLATARSPCEEKKRHARRPRTRQVNGYSNITAPIIEQAQSLASPHASNAQPSSRNLLRRLPTTNGRLDNSRALRHNRQPLIITLPPVGN